MSQADVQIPITDEVLELLGLSFTKEEIWNSCNEDMEHGWDKFKPEFNRALGEFSKAGRMPELLALIGR